MLKTREAIRTQVKGDKLKGALLVVCEFLLPLRKDVRGKKRADQHGNWHSKKPDGDNLEKFVNDACQNIVWVDDAQVACMFRTKRITAEKEGKTVMHIMEIPDEPMDTSSLIALLTPIIEENHASTKR